MPNNLDGRHVQFRIGHTYWSIPPSEAKHDRSGRFLKTHRWQLYIDIVHGNPELLQRVTFDFGKAFKPPGISCYTPIPILLRRRGVEQGRIVWRFSAPPQKSASQKIQTVVFLLGTGGTNSGFPYVIECGGMADGSTRETTSILTFNEDDGPSPGMKKLPMRMIPFQRQFGVELELSTMESYDTATIATIVNSRLEKIGLVVVVVDSYLESKRMRVPSNTWRLVPDLSISCNRNFPNCTKFELVSPILRGGNGLHQLDLVLRAFNDDDDMNLIVNKSMGLHVHIDVSALSVPQLIRVCQNFCKYEDVMDALVPQSRRTGSVESNTYFRSNRLAVGCNSHDLHRRLENCGCHRTVADLMNPSFGQDQDRWSRYYKLNLQNLTTGQRNTIEFRQHSATYEFPKIAAWVRFIHNFVNNSTAMTESPIPFRDRRRPSSSSSNGRTAIQNEFDSTHFQRLRRLTFEFDDLFQNLIKDNALKLYYQKRMWSFEVDRLKAEARGSHGVNNNTNNNSCCDNCG